jgi:hypothetical protein
MRSLAGLFADRWQDEVIIAEEDIFNWLNGQFGPLTKWSPPQVLREDLREALKTLVLLDFNLFYADGSGPGDRNPRYRVVRRMPKKRDLAAWLANRLAKIDASKLQPPKKRGRRGRPKKIRPDSNTIRGMRHIETW